MFSAVIFQMIGMFNYTYNDINMLWHIFKRIDDTEQHSNKSKFRQYNIRQTQRSYPQQRYIRQKRM